jgi:hypothetical protein
MLLYKTHPSVISIFRHEVGKICALLGYYAVLTGNLLPTFRYNITVQFSRVMKSKISTLRNITKESITQKVSN